MKKNIVLPAVLTAISLSVISAAALKTAVRASEYSKIYVAESNSNDNPISKPESSDKPDDKNLNEPKETESPSNKNDDKKSLISITPEPAETEQESVLNEELDLNDEHVTISKTATGDATEIESNGVKVATNLKVTVDKMNKLITVDTAGGAQSLGVTPDAVIKNLVNGKTIDDSGIIITLNQKNGVLVYNVRGIRNKKLLGLFPIRDSKNIDVSATNGETIQINQSFVEKVLDLLSF